MNQALLSPLSGIAIFLAVLLLIELVNWRALTPLGGYGRPDRSPRVAVLLPARNEALNIGACLQSLLAQDYPSFEIVALDDHSSDRTGAILSAFAKRDSRIRVLQARPLPEGWLGKHWACQQLAQAAEAELLLFTDADTVHHPSAVHSAVAALEAERADLLTALPRERVVSWGEKLIVPLLSWSILTFLPLPLAYHSRRPALSATVGQFMLFRRAAYDAIGGHAAVRAHIADDLALGRRIIARGLRRRLVDGGERIECRMYRSGREAFDGFSKNLFAAFDYNPSSFLFVWSWLGVAFLAPLPLAVTGGSLALVDVALALLIWILCCLRLRFPIVLALLYPAIIMLGVLVGFHSLLMTLTGRATWKGRALPRRPGLEQRP